MNCGHKTIKHAFANGEVWERCLLCGKTDTGKGKLEDLPMMKPSSKIFWNPEKSQPVKSIPYLVRKEGDIWDIPQTSSPFKARQWAYQGSGKAPYIVTRYDEKRDGAVTSDGWACACMNFTQHTPRTPCKHILNVKLLIGDVGKSDVKLANVDDKKLKAFEAWEREQAAKKKAPTAGVELKHFGATGRKFR